MPIGFYIYLYDWKQFKDPSQHDLDDALEEIVKRGFNYLYIGGLVADDALWQKILDFCVKHKVLVVPQLDFAYLSVPSQNVTNLVAKAVPFIRKYKSHPAVLAFSVREEPSVQLVPTLKRYYESLLAEVPDAPLYLLHSTIPPLKSSKPPYPDIIGTDRYPFWWEFGSGGHRATPQYALNWYRSQLDAYYQLAVERKAEFQAVFTASTLEFLMSPEQIRNSFYPPTISDKEREQYYHNVEQLAKSKNDGWDEGPNGKLRVWKYYRPPQNCVRTMAWLAILEGARSQAIWAWAPPRQEMQNFAYRRNGKEMKEYICSITGWDGKGTPQLEEYTRFAREIRRYGKIIRVMAKEYTLADKSPTGQTVAPPINTNDRNLYWRSFRLEGYKGRMILVVNTQVGMWCEGRNPNMLSPRDTYRIDDFGNLADYKAFDQPRAVRFQPLEKDMDFLDADNGTLLPAGDDGSLTLSVMPGGGRFLFMCPKGSNEWQRLKRQFGL